MPATVRRGRLHRLKIVRRRGGGRESEVDHCFPAGSFPIFVHPLRVRAGTLLGCIAKTNTQVCFTGRLAECGWQVRGPTLESSRGLFYHFMRAFMIVW